RGVELASTVIRQHDRARPGIARAPCISRREHTLDYKYAAPLLCQPGSIVPGYASIKLTVHVVNQRDRAVADGINPVYYIGQMEIRLEQELKRPLRMQSETEQTAPGKTRRHDHASDPVPLAVAGHWRIHGQTQGIVAGLFTALHEFSHEFPIL